jgi:Flp pilus assembly protein TadG
MNKRNKLVKRKFYGVRGQASAEFAIALPILLAILVGIFEVGRYLFIYSAATNASRNAVRYASAVGLGDGGLHKYKDCAEIKAVARKSAYLVPASDITVSISYDIGPSASSSFAICDALSGEDADVAVSSGDRVIVTVYAQYKPMVKLVPITERSIKSESSRTILGIIELVP